MTVLRRSLTLLLLALLPMQGVLAAGGIWCATRSNTEHSAVGAHAHSGAATVAHSHDEASVGHVPIVTDPAPGDRLADVTGTPASPAAHSTCSACAPCCGSLALPGVPPLGAVPGRAASDDFLPVLVVIRPARSDGIERPPRTI